MRVDSRFPCISGLSSKQVASVIFRQFLIKFAYIAAVDQYLKVEELPSGRGIADVVYLPKRKSMLPALVVELK